jgi:hypothetical protein
MAEHKSYAPGVATDRLDVGDFVLCHRRGLIAALIRFGQAVRFRGERRRFAYWSHAALVVSTDGAIVEALARGVQRGHIDAYRDVEYTVVRTRTTRQDAQQILFFVDRVAGFRYGWSTIVCCALGLVTGGKITFGFQGQSICSGLVARSQERSGAYFDRLAEDCMPADLAEHYRVSAPG